MLKLTKQSLTVGNVLMEDDEHYESIEMNLNSNPLYMPFHVLLNIVSYLDIGERTRATRVCKGFYRIIAIQGRFFYYEAFFKRQYSKGTSVQMLAPYGFQKKIAKAAYKKEADYFYLFNTALNRWKMFKHACVELGHRYRMQSWSRDRFAMMQTLSSPFYTSCSFDFICAKCFLPTGLPLYLSQYPFDLTWKRIDPSKTTLISKLPSRKKEPTHLFVLSTINLSSNCMLVIDNYGVVYVYSLKLKTRSFIARSLLDLLYSELGYTHVSQKEPLHALCCQILFSKVV
mmetsp:Transcript_13051/g.19693  ORF Transcript_13051/g.19693 Transcript_13051/m.19693 type:complete len:286 (-) Transcript_13051:117-974(-)